MEFLMVVILLIYTALGGHFNLQSLFYLNIILKYEYTTLEQALKLQFVPQFYYWLNRLIAYEQAQ